MIIKLKCVDNYGHDYLIVGKVYQGEKKGECVYSEPEIKGIQLIIRPSGCAHAKWEVVN